MPASATAADLADGRAHRAQAGGVDLRRDIVILGAGPCGLGAAWQIEREWKLGRATSYLLVDGSATIGGSAASVTTPEGFVFDYGGHILYPHEEYTEFVDLLNDVVAEWHDSKPVRGVWIDGRLIPYPVQRNIHRLPAVRFLSALNGLCRISAARRLGLGRRRQADNLDAHLRQRFGNSLTNHVLGPINRKMWARDPRQLGTSWTGHRSGSRVANVADASVRQILHSLVTRRDNLGWDETTRVRYPLRGGTGAIWTKLAERLDPARIECGVSVIGIDAGARILTLSDGRRVRYGSLVSSIPLDRLAGLLSVHPAPAGRLSFANAAFVGLGLSGEPPSFLAGVHSFHMPEADIPCWRVSFPKSLSPHTVPAGKYWSILCEISHTGGAAFDIVQAERQIVGQLRRRGILPADSGVVSRWHGQMHHGYPLPLLGRDEALQTLQGALRDADIYSRGRFGGWKYEVSNQDHAFMQGVEAVRMILSNTPETTYQLS